MSRLFISHSSRNNDEAIAMRDWLSQNGWDDVFLDLDPRDGLAPGERWRQALAAAVNRCQAVLCLISPEWNASSWCLNEFLLAKQSGKYVFPIIVSTIDINKLPAEITSNHQLLDVANDPDGWARLKEGLRRAGLDPDTFPFARGRPPYPGFEPFTEQDAAIFFGREAPIVRGLDRLRSMREVGAERMLVILGASGAGKSSYLRAGLWPRLNRDDRNFVLLPVIRPERAAITGKFGLLAALEATVSSTRADEAAMRGLPRSRGAIGDFIKTGPDNLCRLFAGLRAARLLSLVDHKGRAPTVVIAIDQGEELFNDVGRQEAERLTELLAGILAGDESTLVIVGMRSDSFPLLQNEPRLAGVGKVPFDLPPLPPGSMHLVIEGPAQVADPPIKLDPDLVEALLEDSTDPDHLPLLAFTLGRLFKDYGADGELTLAQYEGLGRISGAVNAAVADVLSKGAEQGTLPRDKAALDSLLRQTFIPHLARINKAGQFIRRVAGEAELPTGLQVLIDLFVEARLLVRDRRPDKAGEIDTIEVAHEALLREWPALRAWLEADRDFLIGKDRLAEGIAIWRNADARQKDYALLTGPALTRARQWLIERQKQDLSEEERAFIAASVARAEAATKRKTRLAALAACILLAFTAFAVWQWIEAEKARSVAENARTEAEKARTEAERGLALSRRSTETLVKSLTIQGIPFETLERLLEGAKASLDELAPASGDDSTSQKFRASTISEFGDAYLKVRGKGLEQADRAYSESLRIYQALAAKDPKAIAWQRGIADQIEQIGLVRQREGQLEPAMENHRRALGIREQIAQRAAGEATSHRDLAWSHYNIGEVLMARRLAWDSLKSHEVAFTNIKRAIAIAPKDLELSNRLSLVHVSMGVAYEALGEREKRLESYKTARDIRQMLVSADASNAEWKRVLSWSEFWLASHYLDQNQLDEALKHINACRALRRDLSRSNPWDLVAFSDLAWCDQFLGMALLRKGEFAGAERAFQNAIDVRRQLVEDDKKNGRWRKDLALSHEQLGDLAAARKDPTGAANQFRSAIEILTELIKEDQSNRTWRDSLAKIYKKLGDTLLCSNDPGGLLASYSALLAVREGLLAESKENLPAILQVARSEKLVADVLRARGESDKARAHYQRAFDHAKRVLAHESTNAAARALLAILEKRIAAPDDAIPGDDPLTCTNA